MKAIPCPISSEELRSMYVDQRMTDAEIVTKLGPGATLKRVRSWRAKLGIETLARTDRREVTPITGSLRSLLIGSMLGDGRLSRTVNASRYQENHSDAQKPYIEWKAAQWGSWVKDGIAPVVWKKASGDFHGWRFHTVSHPMLNEWHELFYDKRGPKRLDRKIVSMVDAAALAVWFMDDGSAGWWPTITFGMDVTSQGIAMAIFDQHGFHPRWTICKGNTGNFIFEGENQAHRFIDLVKPHVPECMRYKLSFGFQGLHYQIRQVVTKEVLEDMSARGVPIKRMARELGQSETTVRGHMQRYGIEHPRKIGRPTRVESL